MTETIQKNTSVRPVSSAGRPPIVAVLGHVDHGKTTLLDTIRKTSVASGESGGITQHIGAYQVTVPKEQSSRPTPASAGGRAGIQSDHKEIPGQARDDASQEQRITFIDTPGHEAFAKMRSRGANAADIALLVVAGDDSVKPQTIESIEQIKQANIPIIVVINKIDLPSSNVDRVKQDLARVGVQVEGFGGDVPVVLVSAKQGNGVEELLDLILLLSEMKGLSANPDVSPELVVIETKMDKFRGMVATLIVKQGTLRVGNPLYDGEVFVAKVRAMVDENGKHLVSASPGKPVEVLGFSKLPTVGAIVTSMPSKQPEKVTEARKYTPLTNVADFLASMTENDKKKLNIILKTDAAGSKEAILAALPQTGIVIISSDLGDISESDVLRAKATGAIVVGFHVKVSAAITRLAQIEKVIVRTYTIIYELLDELGEVVDGMIDVLIKERELGRGLIIAEFPYEGARIAGTRVISGRIARGDLVKIFRGEEEIGRGKIKSLRKGKEDVTKAEAGTECGVQFDKNIEFTPQDDIIAITTG